MNGRAQVLALVGFDRTVAAGVEIAVRGYVHYLADAGRPAPPGLLERVDDLRAFVLDSSGHLQGSAGRPGDDRSVTHLLGLRDIAGVAGVCERTVRRHVARGDLRAVKVGRRTLARPEAVMDWLQRMEDV